MFLKDYEFRTSLGTSILRLSHLLTAKSEETDEEDCWVPSATGSINASEEAAGDGERITTSEVRHFFLELFL